LCVVFGNYGAQLDFVPLIFANIFDEQIPSTC